MSWLEVNLSVECGCGSVIIESNLVACIRVRNGPVVLWRGRNLVDMDVPFFRLRQE